MTRAATRANVSVNVETKERAKSVAERSDKRAQAPSLRLGAKRAHQYRSCGRPGHPTPRRGARTCFRERERPPRAVWSRRWLVFRNTHRSRRSPVAKVRAREARDVLPKPDFGPMRRPDVDVGTSRAWATTSASREFGAVHDAGREVCIAPGRIAVRHELHAQRVPQHAILRTTRVRKRHDTGKKVSG